MLSLLQTDSACAAPKCSLGRMDGLSQSPLANSQRQLLLDHSALEVMEPSEGGWPTIRC